MRPLPAATLDNLNPPVRGYRYFDHADSTLESHAGIGSAKNRWLLAEHALLAYEDESRIRSELATRARSVLILSGDTHLGFGFVADLDGTNALLAFRGTQVFKPGDALSKFRAVARDYWTDARIERRPLSDGAWVHAGFAGSADELMEQLQASGQLTAPRRWWIAGHSLGGALAVLAAERLAHISGQQVAGIVTFGQPRVGNDRHAVQLQQLPLCRVVHGCDAIPALPPTRLGFAHAPAEHVLEPERRNNYPRTVLQYILGYWQRWRFGLGALTPVALLDHAPLYYATLCYNEYAP
jgi:pimeloyl-ACP methyl ester carboxylesterase